MDTTITARTRALPRQPHPVVDNRRRGRRLTALLVALSLAGAAAAPSAVASTHVPAITRLAVLFSPHGVHKEPEAGSPQTQVLPSRTPISGEPTTVPVRGSLTAADGVQWLQVMLPGRPNSSTGWIAQQGTRRLLTEWQLVVDLGARRVSAYRAGSLVRTFWAVVGKPSTPTPTGQFFVQETVSLGAGEPGGPYALALSARSNALQEFEGGPGQIALHGRDDLGGTLGAAESHGCVRLATASIDWLSTRIGPGTPVTINAG